MHYPVGTKLHYKRATFAYFTYGELYEVIEVDEVGDPVVGTNDPLAKDYYFVTDLDWFFDIIEIPA